MFHLYGPQGLQFSGSLEKLRNRRKVEKTTKTNAAQKLKNELSDDDIERRFKRQYTAPQKALEQYEEMLQNHQAPEVVYHAYQIMTHPVVTLPAHYSLQQAFEYFKQHPFHLLPVKNDQQQLIALVSKLDIYEILLNWQHAPQRYTGSLIDLLNKRNHAVIAAEPVTDVRRIAAVLSEEGLDAMPIVEDSRQLVGIVSRTDILRCLVKEPPLSLWC